MLGFDPAGGVTSLPVWGAGLVAVLAVVGAVAAWRRSGAGALVAGIAALIVAAIAAGAAVTMGMMLHEQVAERRALEQRVADLTARALVPGSPLACLDGLAATPGEAACEAVLFGRPEAAAAAVAYVTAQIDLFVQTAPRLAGDSAAARALLPLKRALAADRFGLVAHVLAVQSGCSADFCPPLALFEQPDRLRGHLRERPFDTILARHAAGWRSGGDLDGPVAGATAPGLAGTGRTPAPEGAAPAAGQPVSSRYDFPSAASIPPVSIMAPEPSPPAPPVPPRDLPAAVPASPGARPGAAPPAAAPPSAASAAPQTTAPVGPQTATPARKPPPPAPRAAQQQRPAPAPASPPSRGPVPLAPPAVPPAAPPTDD
ncbi:hypothetical protein [Rhodoplanes azumiensis]|uniref:Uncharacterized protein n=1 Tax=Rhodoplanes azumiensis TaxID=1897628 RepID=A0ABW5AEX7_9BRAD